MLTPAKSSKENITCLEFSRKDSLISCRKPPNVALQLRRRYVTTSPTPTCTLPASTEVKLSVKRQCKNKASWRSSSDEQRSRHRVGRARVSLDSDRDAVKDSDKSISNKNSHHSLEQWPCCNVPPREIPRCNSPPGSVLSAVYMPSAANGDVRRDPSIIVPCTYSTAIMRMCRWRVRPEIGWITDRWAPTQPASLGPLRSLASGSSALCLGDSREGKWDQMGHQDVSEWAPDWYGGSSGGALGGFLYAAATGEWVSSRGLGATGAGSESP